MNNYKPEFPHYIDNTMRKAWVKCQQSVHYRHELGLQSKQAKRVDLIAGGAFAKGLEAARKAYYVDGKSPGDAAQIGVVETMEKYGDSVSPKKDEPKTGPRMAGALLEYLNRHPLETETLVPYLFPDGRRGIEFSFSYPIGIAHPVDGKELEYCGKFDMVAVDIEGPDGLWVVDEKTTSSMGDKWANQWPLDSQMTGYVWGAQKKLAELGIRIPVHGAIINGIAVKKYDYDVGRFKTYREPWEIERWYEQMRKDVMRWKDAFLNQNHDLALDHACAYYLNPCEFAPLCKSKSPDRLFEGSYVVEFWRPGEFKE